ncbi:MAG: 50S ribosomal protein L32 [Candidatus Levybacteria bacterium]|nr:50S ribosomal protein L32 [Candidatus Levybacteria bacterium]
MPQEPKKRHSRQRQGKRRASIRLLIASTINCLNCGKTIKPHIVCPHCGFYKGKDFLSLSVKRQTTASPEE